MFDNKKISQKALQRAEEISLAKKRKRLIIIYSTSIVVAICALTLTTLMVFYSVEPALEINLLEFYTEHMINDEPAPTSENPFGNSTNASLRLFNPDSSSFRFKFEIKLITGEKLYESGLLKPSESVKDIKLDKALTPGGHRAILVIQPFALVDDTSFDEKTVEFTLTVN